MIAEKPAKHQAASGENRMKILNQVREGLSKIFGPLPDLPASPEGIKRRTRAQEAGRHYDDPVPVKILPRSGRGS